MMKIGRLLWAPFFMAARLASPVIRTRQYRKALIPRYNAEPAISGPVFCRRLAMKIFRHSSDLENKLHKISQNLKIH
jgi:hypothetical protein